MSIQKKEQARADNRSSFPATAAILDEFRAVFGADVKLIYAEEIGNTIGNKPPEPKRFTTVEQWLNGSELINFCAGNSGDDKRGKRRGRG